ncbi:MAG: hypothetical protein IJ944_03490, partial [Clostridia bacterium]|nr:hypothetical protein [Clostridia bacterium]
EDNIVDAKGHNHQTSVVEPTCVSYGFSVHLCSDCGNRYVTEYVAPTGHDFENTIVEATEDSIGYTKHQCKVCDYSYLSDFVTSGDNGYTQIPEEPIEPSEPVVPSEPIEPENPDNGDNGEVVEPEQPEEIAHEYVFTYEYNEETKILTATCNCECGDKYEGVIQLFVTDSVENTVVMNFDENGVVDFSEMNDDYFVLAIREDGGVVGMFEIKNKVEIPNNPIEPENPVEPNEPEVPDNTDKPDVPGESTEPEKPVEDNQPTEPDNTDKNNKEANKSTNLFPILIGIFAILGIGGLATIIIIKNKKSKNKKEKGDK